jgi:hypothetical protein
VEKVLARRMRSGPGRPWQSPKRKPLAKGRDQLGGSVFLLRQASHNSLDLIFETQIAGITVRIPDQARDGQHVVCDRVINVPAVHRVPPTFSSALCQGSRIGGWCPSAAALLDKGGQFREHFIHDEIRRFLDEPPATSLQVENARLVA